MTELGEEITLLPYDHNIDDHDDGGKTTESEIKTDGNKTVQGKSEAEGQLLPDDQNHKSGNLGDNDALLEQYLPPPPPLDYQIDFIEPDELREPKRSAIPPVPSQLESNFPPSNVDQPSETDFQQPASLPEPYEPQPTPAPAEPGMLQIIATGMNTEMQQYASLLANQAFAQFPNHMMAIAHHIMMNFEQRYGPAWCCIVSNGQLGFYLRYHREHHIYFSLSKHTIFLCKTIEETE